MRNHFGTLLRQMREKAQVTQRALATDLGVTQGAVTNWERDISKPEMCRVPRIAERLGCEAGELLAAGWPEVAQLIGARP